MVSQYIRSFTQCLSKTLTITFHIMGRTGHSRLNELGLGYIWLQQSEFTIPVDLIKQCIFDNYYQSWYSNINNSRRLSMYSRYKHDFLFETYLDTIPDQKFRITLTRVRLSSHNLAIERGRFKNIPRNDRICRYCNLHMVESEYH